MHPPAFLGHRLRLASVGWLLGVAAALAPDFPTRAAETNYFARGIVKSVRSAERQVLIAHEEIPAFMAAMTMPFNVKEATNLLNLAAGDTITFQLHVTEDASWIDTIKRIDAPGGKPVVAADDKQSPTIPATVSPASGHPLRNYKFTNELGQAVSLNDFRGQAIAVTFFFTRCPIPEYCPRLSRNFAAVQRQLSQLPNAPTNWHLLSVTIDPARDTPAVLKSYGATYQYDPAHWSFLTGPVDKITELARLCDVKFDSENGLLNHNFRTLIINPTSQLQMVFPIVGDLSDAIARELLKACDTNHVTKISAAPPPALKK